MHESLTTWRLHKNEGAQEDSRERWYEHLLSILLLSLMQESTMLWVKVSGVCSKHWGLRSGKKKKEKPVLVLPF